MREASAVDVIVELGVPTCWMAAFAGCGLGGSFIGDPWLSLCRDTDFNGYLVLSAN